jgi:hypothetical protein
MWAAGSTSPTTLNALGRYEINTIEGRVLQRLLHKLQEIRDALDDDGEFRV